MPWSRILVQGVEFEPHSKWRYHPHFPFFCLSKIWFINRFLKDLKVEDKYCKILIFAKGRSILSNLSLDCSNESLNKINNMLFK